MLTILLAHTLVAGALPAESPGPPAEPPPPVGVTVQNQGSVEVVEAVLPGRLVAHTVVSPGVLVALVTDAGDSQDDPRQATLWRLQTHSGGDLVPLDIDGLPEDPVSVAAWGQPDAKTLVVQGSKDLYAVDLSTDRGDIARSILAGRTLPSDALQRRMDPVDGRLLVTRPGLLELLHPEVDGFGGDGSSGYRTVATAPLPLDVERRRGGLELRSPPVHALFASEPAAPETATTGPVAVAGPIAEGNERLKILGIDPVEPALTGEPVDASTWDAWARLPGPEDVEQLWWPRIDGELFLAVATTDAERLGIFEKQSFRLFPIRRDRTRSGTPPTLAFQTVTRNWYPLTLRVVDLDRDGRDDLALLQPEGLGAGKLRVEVFRGKGTGGFFTTSRRTTVEIPEGRAHFGEDFDGDGTIDLLGLHEGQLVLHGGEEHRKRVVSKKGRVLLDLALPEAEDGESDDDAAEANAPPSRPVSRVRVLDLDGDGRSETVELRDTVRGRDRLRLVRWLDGN